MRRMPAAAWRVLAACAVALVLCAPGGAARGGEAAAARPPCWYEVRAGDSLTAISKKFYGSHEHWKKIEAANPGIDWRHLKIGQRLRIPALDGGLPAEAQPPAPSPVPHRPVPEESSSRGQTQGKSLPPGLVTLLTGSILINILEAILAFGTSFLFGALVLWWTSSLLRNRMRLAEPSFRKAALATLLCYLLGMLMVGLAMALSALVFLTGMDRATAGQAWLTLTIALGFAGIVWVDCKVLARIYRTSLLGGLVILLVSTLIELVGCCLLCGLPMGIFAVLTGGALAGSV